MNESIIKQTGLWKIKISHKPLKNLSRDFSKLNNATAAGGIVMIWTAGNISYDVILNLEKE